ncbi:MAG: spore coat associated protein CotJA [Clostridia bacterium]|nr:spore coat associated protein CotJA [Clostridia bacterium]
MVYPPEQVWQNIYCVEEGFMVGTIFRELDKPFYGPRCHGGNG